MAKRWLQLLLLAFCTFLTLGATDNSARYNRLGHGLVCQCGCGQILLECNHVNCPVSGPMVNELGAQLASGVSDARIMNWFVNKYGPIVLAAPTRGGFDTVAWVVPFAVLGLGAIAVIVLLCLWKRRQRPVTAAPAPALPSDLALRDRIRRDTTYGE
jgi:cytochrome c-type biogenesis protein CcmH/NrfF